MSQSVTRALQLLTAVASEPRSLDELAEHINVHKTTVLRLLQTMEAERFVTHDSSHRYRLGSRLFDLAGLALEQRDVRAVAREHLERLNATTKQTVHLAVYESGEVVYVDKLDAMQGVRMYSRVGLRAPLHCTAVAKVLMAALPAPAANTRIAGMDFAAMTDRTIRTADAYAAELTRVRRQGYAVDHEEHEAFINCIAAPIRDGSGAVIAAASVSVPTISLPYADVLALLPALLDATAAVSAHLGWHPVVPIA
jgi:DNA-binding IclR family transcriptional regulator